jgi:hypothetical protein
MSISPKRSQGALNAQTKDELIQRYLNKVQWSKDPKKHLAQLRRLTKELELTFDTKDTPDLKPGKNYKPEDVRNARVWFKDQIRDVLANPWGLSNMVPDKLKLRWWARKQPIMSLPKPTDIGKMFFYGYNPKTKDTMPYYDIFPLILMVKGLDNGWQGLNLHYMPPKQRELLILNLMDRMSDTKLDKHTRLKMNYSMLKKVSKYRYFKPCFKRYLASHTTSSVRTIPFEYWPKAILLPVAKFKKSSITSVWADSLKTVRGVK